MLHVSNYTAMMGNNEVISDTLHVAENFITGNHA